MTDSYGMDAGKHALKNLSHLRAYRKDDTPPLSSETLKNFNTPMTYFASFKDLTVDELEYMTEMLDANMTAFHIEPRFKGYLGSKIEGKFDHDLYIKIEPQHMTQFILAWLMA